MKRMKKKKNLKYLKILKFNFFLKLYTQVMRPTRALCGQSETTSHRLLNATSRVEAVIHTCQIYMIYICLTVLFRVMLNLIRYSPLQKLIIRCRDKVSIYASIPPWWVLLIEDNWLFPFSWLHFTRQTQRSKGNLHHSIQINSLMSKLVEPKPSTLSRCPSSWPSLFGLCNKNKKKKKKFQTRTHFNDYYWVPVSIPRL